MKMIKVAHFVYLNWIVWGVQLLYYFYFVFMKQELPPHTQPRPAPTTNGGETWSLGASVELFQQESQGHCPDPCSCPPWTLSGSKVKGRVMSNGKVMSNEQQTCLLRIVRRLHARGWASLYNMTTVRPPPSACTHDCSEEVVLFLFSSREAKINNMFGESIDCKILRYDSRCLQIRSKHGTTIK